MLKRAITIIIQSSLWYNILVGSGNGKHIIIRETATRKALLHLSGAKPQAMEAPLISGEGCSPEKLWVWLADCVRKSFCFHEVHVGWQGQNLLLQQVPPLRAHTCLSYRRISRRRWNLYGAWATDDHVLYLRPPVSSPVPFGKAQMHRKRQKEAPDFMPTRRYKHMLKYFAIDFSTTFAKLSPNISSFANSVITAWS